MKKVKVKKRLKDVIVCRCEEVTEREILEVINNGAGTIKEIKRWTRAGMGLCQGGTCRRLIEQIIARETGLNLKDIDPPSHRIPVRPLKTGVFKNSQAGEEIFGGNGDG